MILKITLILFGVFLLIVSYILAQLFSQMPRMRRFWGKLDRLAVQYIQARNDDKKLAEFKALYNALPLEEKTRLDKKAQKRIRWESNSYDVAMNIGLWKHRIRED